MPIISVNMSNFPDYVLRSDKPVLIDLWASWCGPCKMMSPVLDEIAEAHPEILVCKINVDDEPELARIFRVSSIPMLVLVRDGEVRNIAVGFKPRAQIEQLLKSA